MATKKILAVIGLSTALASAGGVYALAPVLRPYAQKLHPVHAAPDATPHVAARTAPVSTVIKKAEPAPPALPPAPPKLSSLRNGAIAMSTNLVRQAKPELKEQGHVAAKTIATPTAAESSSSKPSIIKSEPATTGPTGPAVALDAGTIAQGIASVSISIDACAQAHPSHQATVIHIAVAPSGKVAANPDGNDPLSHCVASVVERITYPASPHETTFDKTFTF
ncbi:MAG: hypothetical protein QM831_39150 [Kofleriaceae bacterium]